MRFYWLKDRAQQGQFRIYWAPGDENWADYFSKHHSSTHHKVLRPAYLNEPESPADLQGCLKLLKSVLGKKSQDGQENKPSVRKNPGVRTQDSQMEEKESQQQTTTYSAGFAQYGIDDDESIKIRAIGNNEHDVLTRNMSASLCKKLRLLNLL